MTSTVARDSALLAIANRLHYVLLAGDDDRAIEAFALRIHQYGPHSDGPFVTMNAAVLPPILAEAELRSHVLEEFSPEETPVIEEAVRLAADAVECWVAEGALGAMNRFNRRVRQEESET